MTGTWICGRLTAEIDGRAINDKHLSKFTVASNQGDRALFLPVEAWNMEHLAKFLGKGSRVLVAGTLRQDSWETEKGEKRSRIFLLASVVEFLDPVDRAEGPAGRGSPTVGERPSGASRARGRHG